MTNLTNLTNPGVVPVPGDTVSEALPNGGTAIYELAAPDPEHQQHALSMSMFVALFTEAEYEDVLDAVLVAEAAIVAGTATAAQKALARLWSMAHVHGAEKTINLNSAGFQAGLDFLVTAVTEITAENVVLIKTGCPASQRPA